MFTLCLVSFPLLQPLCVPPTTTRVECASCGEEMLLFYDNDLEDWCLRDAVQTGVDTYVHAACAQ